MIFNQTLVIPPANTCQKDSLASHQPLRLIVESPTLLSHDIPPRMIAPRKLYQVYDIRDIATVKAIPFTMGSKEIVHPQQIFCPQNVLILYVYCTMPVLLLYENNPTCRRDANVQGYVQRSLFYIAINV